MILQVPYLRRIWHHVSKKQTSTLKMEDGIKKVREAPEARPFAFVMESAMVRHLPSRFSLFLDFCVIVVTDGVTVADEDWSETVVVAAAVSR